MKKLLLALFVIIVRVASYAQLLSWTPFFPSENNASQSFVITVDALKGNKGLLNHTPGDVYVHTGVITNLSVNASDWKYVKFGQNFTQPNSQLQANYTGNNKWLFTINGSLRSYYGVQAGETIQKVAILFRSGNGTRKQANADGSDMYIPVYTLNLSVRIDQPLVQPLFTPVAEAPNWVVGTNFNIAAKASMVSTLSLYHNNVFISGAAGTESVTGSSTITVFGNQQIVAEANDGTTTIRDTLNVFAAPPTSPVAALPAGVRDGINYEAGNTSAVLVLHAPGKKIATVIGDFNNWTEGINFIMNQTPDGNKFWLRISGLNPGIEYGYQYKVDDSIKIADPYSEKILDPFNDQFISANTYAGLRPYSAGQSGIVSVLQTTPADYTWSVNSFTRPDQRGLIVYELLLRDFLLTHDWKTLTDTLSYFKTLGINAVELLPFNEFEGNESWGYNPNFYFAPDKYYGTKNDLKRFIDSCHKNGIAVIMDIALNHSFGSSPMVQLYFDKLNNRPALNSPWFNPVAKHAFNVGYDMNHERLDTRYFTSRVVEHWLREYRIDGFRFDLSKGFTQKLTCDVTGNNCDVNAWGIYDASRVAIWKRYFDSIQAKSPNAYVILEHFADNTEEKELADYGMMLWGNANYNYSEAAMGYVNNSNFEYGIHSVRTWTKPHLITYMESHDEERIMYKNINFGNSSSPSYNIRNMDIALKRLELNAAFFFTIPGPKMIWQFGELGYDYSINHCPDGSINTNCRTANKAIRWDYKSNIARNQVYHVFSRLIRLRFHPWYKDAFLAGTIEHSLAGAYKTIKVNADTSQIVVVGNFDVNTLAGTITFPKAGLWYDYLNGNTITATGAAQPVNLQPGEYHIYLNRNIDGNIITPVTNIPNTAIALEAKLFPNPASSMLHIEMYLPKSSNVRVSLLNSTGQYIRNLYQSFMQAGKNRLTISKDKLNIASGNYFIRISTKTAYKILQLTKNKSFMEKIISLKTAAIEKITHQEFFNIAISVDCVIFGYEDKQLKVLLIKSDLKEYEGLWSLLGDLVKPTEDLEEASYRVLEQRTGLHDVYLEQVHTFGSIDRHPSGRVITTAYYSLVDTKNHKLKLTENELHWHSIDEIEQMAFDHKIILNTCLQRLREQITEQPLVFNLLQDKFSLRELQDLYEAVLGVELDRRNFRKRMALKNWLVDLNQMEDDVPHRPGKLYKLKTQLKRKYSSTGAGRVEVLPV